jgi:hypothetical protein
MKMRRKENRNNEGRSRRRYKDKLDHHASMPTEGNFSFTKIAKKKRKFS